MVNRFRRVFNFGVLAFARVHSFFLRFVSVIPKSVSIKVTENCNMQCKTCDVWKKDFSENELSKKEIIGLEKELREVGCDSIRFSGGEPLLRDEIGEFVDEAKELGFEEISITTNGLLLSQKVDELQNLTRLVVSIDGMKEVNDELRGVTGGFGKAIKGVEEMREKYPNLPIVISTTISGKNIDDISKLIGLCEEIGLKWSPNLLNNSLYFFRDVDLSDMEPKVNGKIDGLIKFLKRKKRESDVLTISVSQLEYVLDFLRKKVYPKYCILGFFNLKIDSEGEVYSGCWVKDSMGSIREQSLEKIISSGEYKDRVVDMYYRNCKECTCGYGVNVKYENILSSIKDFLWG